MLSKKIFVSIGAVAVLFLVGAWAVESQSNPASVAPADFDPTNPDDYPMTTVIDINIVGLNELGKVYMLEGIENTTAVEYSGGSYTAGNTSYPRLVLHGVFDELARKWRDDIISGKVTKRRIELDLRNQAGRRVLRVTFYDAFPVKFSLPPLSIDNSTRYMERLELVYSNFEITNS